MLNPNPPRYREHGEPDAGPLPRPLVLLVDDEPGNLHVLSEALKGEFEVAAATSGESALRVLGLGERPSLILLDIMMPDMDGYELCKRLKADKSLREIPVIFVTALTDEASEQYGFELGGVDYIHKPFKLPLVRARVRSHLSMQGMLDHLHQINARLNEKVAELNRTNRLLDLQSRALREARTSRNLYERVFSSAGEGIMVTDAAGNIEAVNRAFSRITGYSEAEVLGANPSILKSGHHGADFFRDMWRRLLSAGHWSGEIVNRRKNGETYPELRTISAVKDEEDRITHFVAVFSDISSIKRTQERIDFLTWHDSLTGLPNRLLFLDRLSLALKICHRDDTCAAAMVLDIDGFKAINDAQGLLAGDSVLQEVARRLQSVLRVDDTVARLAADEFALLLAPQGLGQDAAASHALSVAEKLRDRLAQPYRIGDHELSLSCSVGIAVFPSSTQESPVQSLQNADTARHRAMVDGGNQIVFFKQAMGRQAQQRFLLERELQQAIERGELRMYLQSQLNHERQVVGVEALVRWQHPERGLVPPGQFIPMAEETRLIIALDRWMLGEACRLIHKVARAGKPLRVSVNISPKHFREPDFVPALEELIHASGIDPSLLMLEVTEGLMIQDVEEVIGKMKAVSRLGVRFSIDDFGTGYSSLAYIKRLPIHELKIDQSFVGDAPNDPNDALLVEMIHTIASFLNLETVAEGVETELHLDYLAKYPNLIYQGYLFGRPVPANMWLEDHFPTLGHDTGHAAASSSETEGSSQNDPS